MIFFFMNLVQKQNALSFMILRKYMYKIKLATSWGLLIEISEAWESGKVYLSMEG